MKDLVVELTALISFFLSILASYCILSLHFNTVNEKNNQLGFLHTVYNTQQGKDSIIDSNISKFMKITFYSTIILENIKFHPPPQVILIFYGSSFELYESQ